MRIKPGQLVKINLKKIVSPENLNLSPSSTAGVTLFEKIDLAAFPSYKDFIGYNKVFNNETFLVISSKGRPFSFNMEKHWDIYNVYQILYENKMYDCFSYCLEEVDLPLDPE